MPPAEGVQYFNFSYPFYRSPRITVLLLYSLYLQVSLPVDMRPLPKEPEEKHKHHKSHKSKKSKDHEKPNISYPTKEIYQCIKLELRLFHNSLPFSSARGPWQTEGDY